MSDVIACDGCGKVVDREALEFYIGDMCRMVGGGIVDAEGKEHGWDHLDTDGDLCGECAAPVIEMLNGIIDDD